MLKYVDCTKTTDKQTYLTKKATSFKSLRLNYCEIDQIIPKNKINFWAKLSSPISLCIKFQLKLTILIFLPNLLKNGIFGRKQKTMNITIQFYVFELV